MSSFTKLAVVVVCVGGGYILEPKVFPRGDQAPAQPVTNETQNSVTEEASSPNIQLDLSKVKPSDFPEQITLKKPHTINDSVSGVKMDLPKGTLVKPIRIHGEKIIIQPINIPIDSEILADDTDFKELALPKLIARLSGGEQKSTNTANTEPAPEVKAPPKAETKAPEVVTPPVATKSSEPEAQLSEEAIISLMKAHVQAGEVKEFTANQVTSWKIGKTETVDDVSYRQSGRAVFKHATILGEQTHGAIALIQDGEIVKWVWAKNMLEMR